MRNEKPIKELYNHPLYRAWSNMKNRCKSNHNEYWNGRGITVCDRWQKFLPFYKWAIKKWKPGLTLDRRNNDGNYGPHNCRFVTYSVQNSNRRKPKRLPRNYLDYINPSKKL